MEGDMMGGVAEPGHITMLTHQKPCQVGKVKPSLRFTMCDRDQLCHPKKTSAMSTWYVCPPNTPKYDTLLRVLSKPQGCNLCVPTGNPCAPTDNSCVTTDV